jgi:hypothetical protein
MPPLGAVRYLPRLWLLNYLGRIFPFLPQFLALKSKIQIFQRISFNIFIFLILTHFGRDFTVLKGAKTRNLD